ncbi:glycoside hydrolase family 43 protein [Nocardia sp. NPDC004860]|uniref:glycoside hydrolase family 43 protein n=1 Tax=Nocardia sp. NPDC004860 TaxID=3154557 RepID=UPI0033AD51BB
MLNPAVPGFYPDPSICRAGQTYYLACSSFEYFPGVPLFSSTDAEHWTPIGHVATRPGQLALEDVPTAGGVWAPTIRFHDDRFWLVVADAFGRGPLLFTADRAEGPWSDGIELHGVEGIDHDIAWDADGTCYITFSGLVLEGEQSGTHHGIQQVRMDTTTGHALEKPRSLWSGTGLKFPEAPHLYDVDGTWYLLIAEGGTERGHSISIARADHPEGPFHGCPANPIYSHRSTSHPVQNTGHADLVRTDDGWRVVFLGTRPTGLTQAFAVMGRESFQSTLHWVDGWPVIDPITLTPNLPGTKAHTDFDKPLGVEWVSVRDAERDWASLDTRPGWLVLQGSTPDTPGPAMDDLHPHFLGRRQQHVRSRYAALIDAADGIGGLSIRYDELHHYDIEIQPDHDTGDYLVRARVRLAQVEQTWERRVPAGPTVLWITTTPVLANGFDPHALSCDTVGFGYGQGPDTTELADMDGRYLTADTAASFTGRVAGIYAATGTVAFDWFTYEGEHR